MRQYHSRFIVPAALVGVALLFLAPAVNAEPDRSFDAKRISHFSTGRPFFLPTMETMPFTSHQPLLMGRLAWCWNFNAEFKNILRAALGATGVDMGSPIAQLAEVAAVNWLNPLLQKSAIGRDIDKIVTIADQTLGLAEKANVMRLWGGPGRVDTQKAMDVMDLLMGNGGFKAQAGDGWRQTNGLLFYDITPNSLAANTGLKDGDVIVRCGGTIVTDSHSWTRAITAVQGAINSPFVLQYYRAGTLGVAQVATVIPEEKVRGIFGCKFKEYLPPTAVSQANGAASYAALLDTACDAALGFIGKGEGEIARGKKFLVNVRDAFRPGAGIIDNDARERIVMFKKPSDGKRKNVLDRVVGYLNTAGEATEALDSLLGAIRG